MSASCFCLSASLIRASTVELSCFFTSTMALVWERCELLSTMRASASRSAALAASSSVRIRSALRAGITSMKPSASATVRPAVGEAGTAGALTAAGAGAGATAADGAGAAVGGVGVGAAAAVGAGAGAGAAAGAGAGAAAAGGAYPWAVVSGAGAGCCASRGEIAPAIKRVTRTELSERNFTVASSSKRTTTASTLPVSYR